MLFFNPHTYKMKPFLYMTLYPIPFPISFHMNKNFPFYQYSTTCAKITLQCGSGYEAQKMYYKKLPKPHYIVQCWHTIHSLMLICGEFSFRWPLLQMLFKGTQDWDFFWLRFWNLYYFFISYVKILRFYKKKFLIRPLLGQIRFFRLVWD